MKISTVEFPSNLIQGPLAGITCAPMRIQTWRYSTPAYCSTEMVSANTLVYGKKIPARYTQKDPSEGPLCFQLCGNDPEVMAKATEIVDAMDAEIIEINCGCPVQKIRSKGAGSKLLSQPDQLKKLIDSVREKTKKILSIKIRVGGDAQDQDDIQVSKIAESHGVDMLTVHGRHWTERYNVECRYDQIKKIVDSVNIPVIGNGDVKDQKTREKMEETGCAGVMVARHSLGQPWIFEKLNNKKFKEPDASEVGDIFIDHIARLAVLDGDFRAVLQARSMGKYYARDKLKQKDEFLKKLMVCQEMSKFTVLIKHFFV